MAPRAGHLAVRGPRTPFSLGSQQDVRWHSNRALASARTRSPAGSAPAAWVLSIARAIRSQRARSPSRCSPTPLRTIPSGWRAFDREARALASLNHPHIAGIHGVEGGGRAIVMEGGADVRYVSSGHLLYMQQGTLMAAPFDLDRLERTGAPVALVDRVMQAIGAYNGLDETRVGQFDVADNGTLIYLSSGLYPPRQAELVWVDRSGTPTPLPNMPPGGYLAPRVSPDGNRVAVQLTRGQSRLTDVRVYDVARRNHRTLALDGGEHGFPTWSPDGRELAFATRAGAAVNLSRVPIDGDGSGSGKRLMNSRHMQWPASWSSRHGVLAFLQRDRTIAELWMFPMSGDGEPKRFLDVPYSVTHVDFSPDGRWITYESRGEVYLQDYPTPGEPIPISVGGGTNPAWSRNGSELYYLRPAKENPQRWQMMVVDIDDRTGFRASEPRTLFESPAGPTTRYARTTSRSMAGSSWRVRWEIPNRRSRRWRSSSTGQRSCAGACPRADISSRKRMKARRSLPE